ncbi:MAG: PEP/pyruvate-binding domain-containing protein, partial [Candidatus Gracilibacteria bacterium]
NPLNNCYDEAVINSNFGLGETIVAGQVTPDTFIVDKYTSEIIETKVADKSHGLWLMKNGGTKEKDNVEPKKQSLTDKEILEVTELISSVENYFDFPVDIEWAIEDNTLYLLQARPITTYIPLFPELLTKPGEKRKLYLDLAVLTQGFGDQFSVLGLKIWKELLDATKGTIMQAGDDAIIRYIHGKQYIDISNMLKLKISGMIKVYDITNKEIIGNLDPDIYMPENLSEELKGYYFRIFKYICTMIPTMIKGAMNGEKSLKSYLAYVDIIWEKINNDSSKKPEVFEDTVDEHFKHFTGMMKAGGALLAPMISRKKLVKMFKNIPETEDLLVSLNMNLEGNPTSEMGHIMVDIASSLEFRNTKTEKEFISKIEKGEYSEEFMKVYNDYITRFGCRGMKEIDIASERIAENLSQVFFQLKQINVDNNATLGVEKRTQDAYDKLLKIARSIGKEKAFVKHAHIQHTMAGYREHPKYMYVVLVEKLRKIAFSIAEQFVAEGRLDDKNHIFDLNVSQISSGQRDKKLDLRAIREKNLEPYKIVEGIKEWPRFIDSRGKILRYKKESQNGDLVGEAISPGIIRGKAKVLKTPYEKKLEVGEILVTKITEPSWTPIFINASAVVLEIGGPLQHGAIIAREYGLPCVSGIDGLMDLIKDGDMIEVDGSSGIVKIIKE